MEEFLCAAEGRSVLEYANKIKAEKKASTAARIYSSLNGFFRYMVQNNLTDSNPMDGLTAPHVVKNPRHTFTEEEKQAVRSMPKGYGDKAVRDRAMIAVMFDTGYKVSRIINLKLNDVDSLKLSSESKEVLDDYIYGTRDSLLNGNECSHLFTNCDGKPMTRQGFWKIIKAYTKNG